MYYRQGREQKIKNFGGEQIVLTLKMKQKMPGKQFNLYTVCKVVEGRDIPLYDECLTKEQYNKFFDKPSYYQPEIDDKEEYNDETY